MFGNSANVENTMNKKNIDFFLNNNSSVDDKSKSRDSSKKKVGIQSETFANTAVFTKAEHITNKTPFQTND